MAKKIDYEQMKALCRMKPTLKDVAAFFDCSEDTIERRCKEWEGMKFAEFRDKYMVEARFDLIRKALKMAEKSPAVMIFCLKNLCKWSDNPEGGEDDEKENVIQLRYALKPVKNGSSNP
jgi:AraC-like DNA-binding protein